MRAVEEKEESVRRSNDSLLAVLKVVRQGWWAVALSGLVFGVLTLVQGVVETPLYRSTATLYVTSGADDNTQSAYQGSLASQQRVSSYLKLAKSSEVLVRGAEASGLGLSGPEVADMVSVSDSPGTVLISISADSEVPDVASRLANGVASAFGEYISVLERPAAGGDPLAKVTIVSPAVPSADPISPRIYRNTALGICVGIVFGLIAVFLRDRLDSRIRTQDDLAEALDVPILSVIPADSSLSKSSVIDFGVGSSAVAEAFRRLRTNLGFVSVDGRCSTYLVTSSLMGDGKSTIAINLSAALAESGKRVLIVDADLRRPVIAGRLGVSSSVGLTTLLRDDCELSDVVQSTSVPGLDALASGPLPPNPAELLGSQLAGRYFEMMGSTYDYVIIDSPPVLPVADSAELSKWVDGVLLVTRANVSRIQDVTASVAQIAKSGSLLAGVTLNGVKVASTKYGYGYGYVSGSAETVSVEGR